MYQQVAKDGAYVARGGQVLGSIRIADVLASQSEERRRLHEGNGKKTFLLGRDTQNVEAFGELLPDQKAQWVSRLRANNRKVAMVATMFLPWRWRGHGIRIDVSRESADIIPIGSDLPKFVETLRVARRRHGIIMQNFLGTLLVTA